MSYPKPPDPANFPTFIGAASEAMDPMAAAVAAVAAAADAAALAAEKGITTMPVLLTGAPMAFPPPRHLRSREAQPATVVESLLSQRALSPVPNAIKTPMTPTRLGAKDIGASPVRNPINSPGRLREDLLVWLVVF
jgi:hypothetical protein